MPFRQADGYRGRRRMAVGHHALLRRSCVVGERRVVGWCDAIPIIEHIGTTRAATHVGIVMTLIALITGAIWGQPMWGT
jgi:hypothetical protein